MRVMMRLGLVAVTLLMAPPALWAQATGQITGIVTDTSGAVLPGVTVEATNTATGAVRSAVTGDDGVFTLPLIQPGVYDVKATLSGFRVGLQEGVRVTVSETARATFQLEVGQVTETVTVTAVATARRDGQRHARHRHRPAEGGRPAAERPQLHPARDAHPRRRRAADRPRRPDRRRDARRLRQRHRRLQRQRHAQPVQQLPDGRRHQQRHVQHRLRAAAAARRDPGVQDPDPRLRRRVRPQRRVGRERRDQVGQQHADRRGVGVQPRRRAAGAQLLRARQPAQARAEAEPVRRRRRRPDRQEPAVRLRLLRGLPQRGRHHHQRRGAVGGAARRQLRRDDDPRSADRPAVPQQHDSGQPHQPGGGAAAQRVRAAAELGRQPLHRVADGRATCATSSAPASTTSSPQNQSLLLRYMRAETERTTPKIIAAGGSAGAGHAAGRDGVLQLGHRLERHQRRRGCRSTGSTPTRR